MTNVVFDRETLKVVGVGRPPFPYEFDVLNVDPMGYVKVIQVPTIVDKVNAEGKCLYLLPQDDLEVHSIVQKKVETPKPVSDDGEANEPIIIKTVEKIPEVDENGKQKFFQPVSMQETTSTVDYYGNPTEPVMVKVFNEDGPPTEVQKTDEQGNKIYMGLMPSGSPVPIYTARTIETQKKDAKGNLLYYETVEEHVVTYEKRPPLEITEDDPSFREGLEKITEIQMVDKVITFEQDMTAFTFSDIVNLKRNQLIQNYGCTDCLLFEQMDADGLFSTDLSSFNSSIGVTFVIIPAGGTLRTQKVSLPNPASIIKIITETSAGNLEISVGDLVSTIEQVDSNNERHFDTPVDNVYVQFKNTTDRPVSLISFAILV